MPPREPDRNRVEEDAEAIDEKYGSFAEVYAETRAEAAEGTKSEAAKDHWKEVAETLESGQ